MNWLQDASYALGGAVLANAVPHFVNGICGRAFQTPFASPPGKGLSSSTTNVLWSWLNLVVAYLLILRVGRFDLRATESAVALGLGILLCGVLLARSFGRLHGGHAANPPQPPA